MHYDPIVCVHAHGDDVADQVTDGAIIRRRCFDKLHNDGGSITTEPTVGLAEARLVSKLFS